MLLREGVSESMKRQNERLSDLFAVLLERDEITSIEH